MWKIGRNDPCPCGSGIKYKKCCLNKHEQSYLSAARPEQHLAMKNLLTYEEVNEMSTAEIIQRLESLGIKFDKDIFLRDVERFYSAEQISMYWFQKFKVAARGRDEDFSWLAAWVLWERLAPSNIMSMEQMSDLIDKGFEYISNKDSKAACDIWLEVWEAIKYRDKPEFRNLDFLNEQYKGSFFISNFIQDLEKELYNAGRKDKAYLEKRINYCREFISHFPDEDELIIHNMRRAIAESYARLGNYEQAESECEKLVRDYPDNPWGYIEWGDMYREEKKDYIKAKYFYEKGLSIAKDKIDIISLNERLEDLEHEIKMG